MSKEKKPSPPPIPKTETPKLPPQVGDNIHVRGQVPKMENPPPPKNEN